MSQRIRFVRSLVIVVLMFLGLVVVPASALSSWQLLSFSGTGVFSIAFSPTYATDGLLIAGTSNGTYRSTDRGATWSLITTDSTSLLGSHSFSPDYINDHTVFAASGNGVYRSTDGGVTWNNVGLANYAVNPIAVSPSYATDRTVFVGTTSGHVFRSRDAGVTWSDLSLPLASFEVRFLAISPDYATDQTIFAGTGKSWEWYGGGVYRSTDGGNTWVETNNGLTYKEVGALAISPQFGTDHMLFVTVWNGGVFRSTDGGNTWVESNSGQPNRRSSALAVSPNFAVDHTVLLGTWGEYGDGGIYLSNDSGATWAYFSDGLTTHWIHRIAFSPSYTRDGTVLAGGERSNGGGLWKYNFESAAPTRVDYFALGDSVASGHGLSEGGLPCRQSPRSYPAKVAHYLEGRYDIVSFPAQHFLACSGASVKKPKQEELRESEYRWFVKQVDAALSQISPDIPTLVSITIGANDFEWSNKESFRQHLYVERDDEYKKWVRRTVDDIKRDLRKDLKRLLDRPNVVVVVTEVHNPFNRESVFFKYSPIGDRCLLVDCYNRVEYGVHELNRAFIDLWVEMRRPDRLQVTAIHEKFHGHEAPRPSCGSAGPDVVGTWIQYKDDPSSYAFPPLGEDIAPGLWRGDCFHPNEVGAREYALEVNQDALRMGR